MANMLLLMTIKQDLTTVNTVLFRLLYFKGCLYVAVPKIPIYSGFLRRGHGRVYAFFDHSQRS